jgi:hypothetical protein
LSLNRGPAKDESDDKGYSSPSMKSVVNDGDEI